MDSTNRDDEEASTSNAPPTPDRMRHPPWLMEDPWHVEVRNACTGEHMLGPLPIYPTEKVGSLMRRLQYHAWNVRANDDPTKRFKIIFRGCELHPLDDMRWAILDGMPFPMIDTTQKIVLKAIAVPVLLSWDQFLAMPAIRDRHSGIDDAYTKLIRPLRRLCNETAGNAIDISEHWAYDWRQLLKIMPTHSTRQLIGLGITGVAFWHVNPSEDDREIFPLNPIDCEDACSFFEITSANGDQWHINIHTSADSQLTCSLDHFPFPHS